MESRRVAQVDALTGEIMEGAALALIFPKRRNGFGGGWLAMAQSPLEELARADLGAEAMRVLFIVLGRLDYENWLNISQAEVGRLLGMKRQSVGRAFGRLIDERVILEGPKVGKNGTYRLNPSYGWKGSAKGHHEALAERMRARGISVVEGGGAAPAGDDGVDRHTMDLFEPVSGEGVER